MQVRAWLRRLLEAFPVVLARFGLVDRQKGVEALDLAAPVMVTGGLRVALRLADYLMVGIALGEAVIAGLALPAGYAVTLAGLSIPLGLGLGLGLPAVFLALLVDFYVRALVNATRFRSGRWRAIARSGVRTEG